MTREMSQRQFSAALRRAGFRHECFWYFRDTTGAVPNVSFPGAMIVGVRNKVTLLRRETVAKLIRQRRKESLRRGELHNVKEQI